MNQKGNPMRTLVLLSVVMLMGCEAQRVRTGWITANQEYPATFIELIEGVDENGLPTVDLGMMLASDLDMTDVVVTKRVGGDVVLEMRAAQIGATRSTLFDTLPAVIEQRAVQLGVAADIAVALADTVRRALVPTPADIVP